MADQTISFENLDAHFRGMAAALNQTERRTFLQRVVGESMRDMVKASFQGGRDPDGAPWMSTAEVTAYGGKFAASYKVRPSGATVSADKKRLTDTQELGRSYAITVANADMVEVGPEGERNIAIASRAEGDWQNKIVGWSAIRLQYVAAEIAEVFQKFTRGIPIGRIRKPNIRTYSA